MTEPFIIAEIGSNFTSREDVLNSITQAKLSGADAVKYQLYTHKDLYGFDGEVKGQLDPLWLAAMRDKAQAVGIELMCTAFSPEGYDIVNPFVKFHKVASSELTHKRILQKVKSFGKMVFLSTGAAMEDEIKEALRILDDTPLTLMYCVGAYPARTVDVTTIALMQQKFNVPMGYSDHTTDVLMIPALAVTYGATVIEKHVSFIDAETPDKPHSLNGAEFKLMCENLKQGRETKIGPLPSEKDMVLRHKRRIMATQDIQIGEYLFEGVNFGIYRSKVDDSAAMHGFSVDEVNGKVSLVDLVAGSGIASHYLANG